MHYRGGPAVALLSVLIGLSVVAGCASPSGGSAGSSSAPSSSTDGLRAFGPDPGAAAYRALDLCRLVDLKQLQSAYAEAGGNGRLIRDSGGPSACDYEPDTGNAWARLSLAAARDKLPPHVRTTELGVDKIETTPEGSIIFDPALTTFFVIGRSGYLLSVTGPGNTLDAARLAKALSRLALAALAKPLPRASLPASSIATMDICEGVRAVGMAQGLGVAVPLEASVDSRICIYPDRFWVAWYPKAGYGRRFDGSGAGDGPVPVQIGPVTAQVRADICELIVPLREAPDGAGWAHESLLARAEPGGPPCDDFIAALEPLVARLKAQAQ